MAPRSRRPQVERDETDAFLMGGDAIPALFKKAHPVGSVFEGEILDKKMSQQTDAKTREPKFWDDGNPRMQLVITLQTDYDDEPNDDTGEDDGRRRLYVRGEMQKAISAAVRKAGEQSLKIGGTLKVKYTGNAKPTGRGLDGAKLFVAKYTAPDPDADTDVDEFLGSDDDDAPPPRKAAAKAPAKRAARKPEPKPVEDDDDEFDDDPEPEPAPRRRRAAAKAPAKKAAAKIDDELEDDGDDPF